MSDDLPPGITQADIDQQFTDRGFYTVSETLTHLAVISGSGKMKRDPAKLLISAHHHIEIYRDRIKELEDLKSVDIEFIDKQIKLEAKLDAVKQIEDDCRERGFTETCWETIKRIREAIGEQDACESCGETGDDGCGPSYCTSTNTEL